jgi:LysM repeat protein
MKILKIIGVVFAVHVGLLMFALALPGCRTTSRSATPPPPPSASEAVPAVTYPGAASAGPVSATPGDAANSMSGADLNPGTAGGIPPVSFNGGAPSGSQHFNPTRPGTPVADVLEAGDVTGVTPATTYKVVANDSLWKVAKKHGLGVEDLAKANNLKPNSPLKVGQKLIIPGKQVAAASTSGAAGASGGNRNYTVKAGESLGAIAHKHGTTIAAIRALNPQIKNDTVRAGQDIVLPGSAQGTAPAASTAPAEKPAAPVAASTTAAAPAGSVEHIVKPGEGLSQIAKKYGVPMREIAALNNIANPTSLRAGQKLIIPGVKTPAAAPAIKLPSEQAPVAPSESPVAPAPATEANPISTAPASDAPAPPVVKVEEPAPVAPANN